MIRISILTLALLASLFVPLAALAQTSPAVQQAVDFCEARHPQERIKQEFCIRDQKLLILGRLLESGQKDLAGEVARLREELATAKTRPTATAPQASPPPKADTVAARAAIKARAAELKAKQAPSAPAPPSAAFPAPPPPPPPRVVGGVPYRVVPTPGKFAATTYDVSGARLRLWALQEGVDEHVYGANEVRIVVKRDGVPITVEHTGGVINAIRADLNGDGKIDRAPYSAVDPFMIETIYIPQVGPKTNIELVYLVPTGESVEVPGLPPTQLWGDPKSVKYEVPPRPGRFETKANFGWSL